VESVSSPDTDALQTPLRRALGGAGYTGHWGPMRESGGVEDWAAGKGPTTRVGRVDYVSIAARCPASESDCFRITVDHVVIAPTKRSANCVCSSSRVQDRWELDGTCTVSCRSRPYGNPRSCAGARRAEFDGTWRRLIRVTWGPWGVTLSISQKSSDFCTASSFGFGGE